LSPNVELTFCDCPYGSHSPDCYVVRTAR
jgi:hypothetical protein